MERMPFMRIDGCAGVLLALAAGCSSPCAVEAPPSLLQELGGRGVTDRTTLKVVIRSSEGSFGRDTVVTATEHFIVQGIWDTVYASRPDPYWCACGFDEIEFYTSRDAREPAATLLLNESGSAHLKGKEPREGFRCPGLEPFIRQFLQAEYKKKHPGPVPG